MKFQMAADQVLKRFSRQIRKEDAFNWPVSQWATDLKINVTKTLALRVDAFCIGYLGGSPHLLPKPPSVRRSL